MDLQGRRPFHVSDYPARAFCGFTCYLGADLNLPYGVLYHFGGLVCGAGGLGCKSPHLLGTTAKPRRAGRPLRPQRQRLGQYVGRKAMSSITLIILLILARTRLYRPCLQHFLHLAVAARGVTWPWCKLVCHFGFWALMPVWAATCSREAVSSSTLLPARLRPEKGPCWSRTGSLRRRQPGRRRLLWTLL